MIYPGKTLVFVSALSVSILGLLIWKLKKKKSFIRVGKVFKILFLPIKSLKANEIAEAYLTRKGLCYNGLLDRSFMLISQDKTMISQRQYPQLVFLTAEILGDFLNVTGPDLEPLKVEIKKSFSSEKVIECMIHSDSVKAVDCGDEAANWFQRFLQISDIRLVQHVPDISDRKYLKNNEYIKKYRAKNPVSLQDLSALNLLSQASIDDLNIRLNEKDKVSVFNFRPNILVEESECYAEDEWKHIKFASGAEVENFMLCSRCLMTTNNPQTGILTQKEPMTTLRKYRIPKDPKIAKLVGYIPCLGINCIVLKEGNIKVGDEIYATKN